MEMILFLLFIIVVIFAIYEKYITNNKHNN
jgi:hypothetical protein